METGTLLVGLSALATLTTIWIVGRAVSAEVRLEMFDRTTQAFGSEGVPVFEVENVVYYRDGPAPEFLAVGRRPAGAGNIGELWLDATFSDATYMPSLVEAFLLYACYSARRESGIARWRPLRVRLHFRGSNYAVGTALRKAAAQRRLRPVLDVTIA
jgi:hypothetical protein